jgi:hypothetical protein
MFRARTAFVNLLVFGVAAPVAYMGIASLLHPVLEGHLDRYLAAFLAGAVSQAVGFFAVGLAARRWTPTSRALLLPAGLVALPLLLALTAQTFVSHPQWLTVQETFTIGLRIWHFWIAFACVIGAAYGGWRAARHTKERLRRRPRETTAQPAATAGEQSVEADEGS